MWSSSDGSKPAQFSDIEVVYGKLVAAIIGFAGIVFFIMLLVGGFKFLTAGGEAPALESARKTITTAIAGLVLVAISYLIIWTLAEITGSDFILDFVVVNP